MRYLHWGKINKINDPFGFGVPTQQIVVWEFQKEKKNKSPSKMHIWIKDYKYQRVQMVFMHLSWFENIKRNAFNFSHLGHGFQFFLFLLFLLFCCHTLPAHNLHYKYFLHVIRFLFFFRRSPPHECIKTPLPVWHAIWDSLLRSSDTVFGVRLVYSFKFSSAHNWCSISLSGTDIVSLNRMLTRAFNSVHHHKSRYFVFWIPSMWGYLCSSDSICDTSFKLTKKKKTNEHQN